MINENFITRVIQVLLEMRLDEGFVKDRNKRVKNAIASKIGRNSVSPGAPRNIPHSKPDNEHIALGRKISRKVNPDKDLATAGTHRAEFKDARKIEKDPKTMFHTAPSHFKRKHSMALKSFKKDKPQLP